ncbi:glycerol-3-phosphate O-acyltransferase 3/4 [Sarotherodon galilaeus]
MPNIVRTPDRHSLLQLRAPELKRSSNLSLPVAWITGTRHRTRREAATFTESFTFIHVSSSGCATASIHRRDPTTERHGGFDLLRLRPGPVHPSLDDLVVPGSPRITISMPNLVRTPDRHSLLQLRAPELKRSSNLSLPVAWITGTRHRTRREAATFTESFTFIHKWDSNPRLQRRLRPERSALDRSAILTQTRCATASIHRRDPTTERHGGFDLLRLRPGPVHPSLDDLVVPGSPRITISMPNLVRTPDRHSLLQLRAPELKRSSNLSLPVAWITGTRHRTRREAATFTESFTFIHVSSSGCATASIHRRDPTTERHGGFDLLRLRPGPVHPSLDDLVVPGSPRITISMPNLVRTPDRHSLLQLRAPELKRSSNLSLPVAWITGTRHRTRREAATFTESFTFIHVSSSGCATASIHRRDPTTERHGGFDLLRRRPGPVHPSLDDLVVPGSPRITISMPNLVRTPDRHSLLQLRAPELKRSSNLSLPVAWITGTRHRTRREAATFTESFTFIHVSSSGCATASIHRRDPTTERHGGFDLLRRRPGPVHPSLDDLVVPGSPRITISMPNLVRTPDRHSLLQLRAPELKRSSNLSLPVAWITGTRHRTRREAATFTESFTFIHVSSSGCATASIHRRDPTTERHGGFDLLRLRPGPVHPSLDDLVVPGSPRITISMPNLVRTPDRQSLLQLRAPELKRSSNLSLPVAWITGTRHRTRREAATFTESFTFIHVSSSGCATASIHRRDPTTERHGGFDLLRLRPGPVHPSLDDLVVPGSPRITISMPNLVRTPDRHSLLQLRAPELKRSSNLSLPVAWITGTRHRTRREAATFTESFTFIHVSSSAQRGRERNTERERERNREGDGTRAGCATASIHRRDPTTERHGGFDLLRLRPGPVHPSLDDLVVPGSPRITISMPNLVRTPDRHSLLQLRAPELKRSSNLSLPVAWITGTRHRTRREAATFTESFTFIHVSSSG